MLQTDLADPRSRLVLQLLLIPVGTNRLMVTPKELILDWMASG